MPRIITVSNTKGGCGKSTLTLNIHNYLKEQGAKVAICDTDYQQTITDLNKGNIDLIDLNQIGKSDYQFVVVDTPPYRTHESSHIFSLSDFLLILVLPSILDFKAAQTILSDAREANVLHAVVMNRVKAGSDFPKQIRKELENQGIPVLKNQIGDRIAYARSMLFESLSEEGNKTANDEIANLTSEILIKITS